jgi:hypothetical protein
LNDSHVQIKGVVALILLLNKWLLNREQARGWCLLLGFVLDLRLHFHDTLLLGISSHDLALLHLLFNLLADSILALATFLLEGCFLSGHSTLSLAQRFILYETAVQKLVLLFTILEQEIAHIYFVKIRMHI